MLAAWRVFAAASQPRCGPADVLLHHDPARASQLRVQYMIFH